MGQQASKQQRATAKKAAELYHEAALEAAAGDVPSTSPSRALAAHTTSATSAVQRSLERNGLPFVKDELIAINRFVDPSADIGLLQSMTVVELRKLIRSNIVLRTMAAGDSANLTSRSMPTVLVKDAPMTMIVERG